MANWVEIVTDQNIGRFVEGMTYVDTRVLNKGTIDGFWNRNKDICPYLKDSTAYAECFTNVHPSLSANNHSSAAYAFGRSNIQRCGMTTGRTDAFSAGDPDGDGYRWRPQVDQYMIENGIYNPWQRSSVGYSYRIIESRVEVTYGPQNEDSVTFGNRLSLSWATFNRDSNLTHQTENINTVSNAYYGNSFVYADEAVKTPVDIIGGNDNDLAVPIITEHDEAQDNTVSGFVGYQGVNVTPSMATGDSDSDVIPEGKVLVPIIGGFIDNEGTGTTGWLGETYDSGGANDWQNLCLLECRTPIIVMKTIIQRVL